MKISLIVPVLNEEESIQHFYKTVINYEPLKQYEIEIVFINDGSTDKTEAVINEICKKDSSVKLINFSRNFGKDAALVAGFANYTGEVCVPIDVDLQDPIEIIPKFIEKYNEGYDAVIAQRTKKFVKHRKIFFSALFYKIYNSVGSINIVKNNAEFGLISKKVTNAIMAMPENQIFIRGLLAWVGFKKAIVPYVQMSRQRGSTSFTQFKLIKYALNAIVSFSTVIAVMWAFIGSMFIVISLLALACIGIFSLLGTKFSSTALIINAVMFFSGVQLTALGVLGKYIRSTQIEAKRRPKYIIKNTVN